ncbi:hypothetical protein R84981_000830 [Carnimonas sp. R-84981]|uniref:DUF6586 family protein n=1 Tax=Carnimonas bestiolae TaxID=3402172 RepID=UPI003EDC3C6F
MEQRRRTHELLYHAEVVLKERRSSSGLSNAELPPAVRAQALEQAATALIDAALHSAVIECSPAGTVVDDWRSYLREHADDSAELRRLSQQLLPGGELSVLFDHPLYAPQAASGAYAAGSATIASDAQKLSLEHCLQRLKALLNELRESSLEW